MKRDMEKVRGVMLALEALPHPMGFPLNAPAMGGAEDWSETAEYLRMLQSGGYLERSEDRLFRITWAGHEFLDSVRDPEIWRQAKDGASKVGSWSITLLGELAKGLIRAKAAALGLPTG